KHTVILSETKDLDSSALPQNDNKDLLIIINPVITKKSKDLYRYPEICMSANPLIAPVVRPAWIEFSYLDEHGKEQLWETKDDTKEGRLYNRVFQHEIDHMDGIINIDKVQSNELIFESDPTFYDKATFEKAGDKPQ
ncbi:MAG: peptide deformylase, partial [Candidatus Levybacteria bacterium]|nr:peptide deformylase [Candidatus Levybacteria bacterium]